MRLVGFLPLIVVFATNELNTTTLLAKYTQRFIEHAHRSQPRLNTPRRRSANNKVWPWNGTVYVLPDLHGDFHITVGLLNGLGLMDSVSGKFTVNSNTHFIQLGDIADRGQDSPAIYELLWDLSSSIQQTNGTAAMLVGNHEVMLMKEQSFYLHPSENLQYYHDEYTKFWRPPHGYLAKMITSLHHIAYKLGDVAFSHAGLILPYAGPSAFTKLTSAFMSKLRNNDPNDFEILWGATSPIWTRSISMLGEEEACPLIETANRNMDVSKQVVGHTITASANIETRCLNSLTMVDTGNSRAFSTGKVSALVVTMNDFGEEDTFRWRKRKWVEYSGTVDSQTGAISQFHPRTIFTDKVCTDLDMTRQMIVCPPIQKTEL